MWRWCVAAVPIAQLLAAYAHSYTKPSGTLAMVGIFKNEADALHEWLTHHFAQGVAHAYLIDNNSSDAWPQALARLGSQRSRVTVVSDATPHAQVELYNKHFLKRVQEGSHSWVMVVDADEFIYAPRRFASSIPDVLATAIPRLSPAVELGWKVFGSTADPRQPAVGIRRGFLRRARYDDPPTGSELKRGVRGPNGFKSKSIVRTACLRRFIIHNHELRWPWCIGALTARYPTLLPSLPFVHAASEAALAVSPLHLNHYRVQSFEYFMTKKAPRGDVLNAAGDSLHTPRYFQFFNRTEVFDDALARIASGASDAAVLTTATAGDRQHGRNHSYGRHRTVGGTGHRAI